MIATQSRRLRLHMPRSSVLDTMREHDTLIDTGNTLDSIYDLTFRL